MPFYSLLDTQVFQLLGRPTKSRCKSYRSWD